MSMKKNRFCLMMVMSMMIYSLHVSAQVSGGEFYKQASSLQKKGSCNDAQAAIKLYQQAKKNDTNLRLECDKRIQECMKVMKKECAAPLEISAEQIEIPYQGGDSQIGVNASKSWDIEGNTAWCNTESYDKNSFVVQCREQNNSTRARTTTLTVKSGSLYKTLKVVQAARPEYIEVGATALSFPSSGTTEQIEVKSNANWVVSSAPSWCKIEKADTSLYITVLPNEGKMERVESIIISSPSKELIIKIYQGAGEEHLTLSQNNIVFPADGGKHYMKVYTDADNWFVGDFQNWLNVQRIGKDSICIECGKNIPNGQERSGSVQVRTDRQTAGVMVTQAARMPQDIIFPDSKIIGGNNISLGISASYYMPFISTSAGGDYVGSVVDYSLGNSSENASYKSATGFSIGLFADIRLYKNIFLIAGANFTQIKYNNSFNLPTTLTIPYSAYQYQRGEVQNSYKEDYTHNMIEVPILASYRFKINNVSHLQLNLGPVLNFGLSSKMKLSGTTDGEMMHIYNASNNSLVDNSNYLHHTSTTADFDLYKKEVNWTESYTTGNKQDEQHRDVFSDSPLRKFNYGLRIGAAYEIAGIQFGLSYTMMLSNMANEGYWSNKRLAILNESTSVMTGYKHRIHTLEFKIAYTLRYLKF